MSFVLEKVRSWVSCLQDLISVTGSQPQASYHALVKSFQSEWTFLERAVPDCGQLFEEIEQLIVDWFIPLLIGSEVTASERVLMSLPVRFRGLGLKTPVKIASVSYKVSRDATVYLAKAIGGHVENFEVGHHMDCVLSVKSDHAADQDRLNQVIFSELMSDFDTKHQRILERSRDCLSAWLIFLPVQWDGATEFQDGLALQYGKPLLQLPPFCDGCGSDFTIVHALDCKKGCLIAQRHNEIRDTIIVFIAWPLLCGHRLPRSQQ